MHRITYFLVTMIFMSSAFSSQHSSEEKDIIIPCHLASLPQEMRWEIYSHCDFKSLQSMGATNRLFHADVQSSYACLPVKASLIYEGNAIIRSWTAVMVAPGKPLRYDPPENLLPAFKILLLAGDQDSWNDVAKLVSFPNDVFERDFNYESKYTWYNQQLRTKLGQLFNSPTFDIQPWRSYKDTAFKHARQHAPSLSNWVTHKTSYMLLGGNFFTAHLLLHFYEADMLGIILSSVIFVVTLVTIHDYYFTNTYQEGIATLNFRDKFTVIWN